jgi:hypothetical protein
VTAKYRQNNVGVETGDPSADPDDLHGAEIRCLLCTTTERVRHNTFCPVTAETIFFDDFRERIAGILVKDFRADIPARPAAYASPPVDNYVHFCNPNLSGIPVASQKYKANEEFWNLTFNHFLVLTIGLV